MHPKRVYQWVIEKYSDGMYSVTGYTCDGTSRDKDGATAIWSYVEAPLEHIRKQETEKLIERK